MERGFPSHACISRGRDVFPISSDRSSERRKRGSRAFRLFSRGRHDRDAGHVKKGERGEEGLD